MKYCEVVKEAKRILRDRYCYGNNTVTLYSCEDWEHGNQINLWTYWQGFQLKDIDEKGVDILLVGQDWGNPKSSDNIEIINRIREIQSGDETVEYLAKSPTDKNLKYFFEAFNVDLERRDNEIRLFFTNYCLGYRSGQSETGGMTQKIMREDRELFELLVLSIKPKVIICLGKDTYEMVTDSKTKEYLKYLKRGKAFKSTKNKTIKVYGVPHSGTWGTANIGTREEVMVIWRNVATDCGLIR